MLLPLDEHPAINGYALDTYRRLYEYTQKELAAELGISQPYLSQLLTGKAKPTIDLARRIAALVEEPLVEILLEYDILKPEEVTAGGAPWTAMAQKISTLAPADQWKLVATFAAMTELVVAETGRRP
jgi:transcriptional regulator with XRE-family HTH domain